MEFIADLHIHSKYARACSEQLTLENMQAAALQKGISVMGTGDFTHPMWFEEMKDKLKESGRDGLYSIGGSGVQFILSSEVCTIFEQKGISRKIHHLILAPDFDSVEQINSELSRFGSLESDGRPILSGLRPAQLVEIVMGASRDAFIYPAHAWTPWFGALGSFSGFDSLEDAYEDQAKHVHALEMGLSSDPSMNWRVSKLDRYTLLAGSDAHSLPKIGREAIVLDSDGRLSYKKLISTILSKKLKRIIKFYPEEGKYHFDGHRNCGISLPPEEAKKYNYMCPKCGKRLTLGVLHRVNELADRPEGFVPKDHTPYVHAVQLEEIIAYAMKKSTHSPYVKREYQNLLGKLGKEFDILLNIDTDRIKAENKDVGMAIERVRQERVHLIPGYDGVFGVVDIFNEVAEKREEGKQSRISEF